MRFTSVRRFGTWSAGMSLSATLELAMELVRRPSITPDDAGCQQVLADRLGAMGFHVERLQFAEVDNLWATRGQANPLFVFAGHSDVVPPGPAAQWQSLPFEPSLRDGYLYGRGAADMKGSLASMITAAEHFVGAYPDHRGRIGFLITGDEEGPAQNGTVKVMERLRAAGEQIDWCVVGEPTSSERLGDTVKIGRRGSLNGVLTVKGVQGHVAYPQLALNPVHQSAAALGELCTVTWDRGNEFFPPTSLQISNLHAGTGVENVIPGHLEVMFNLRYSTEVTADELKVRVEDLLDRHGFRYKLRWRLSGEPFLTSRGRLLQATLDAIREITGLEAELSTTGGTSDGRFIAPTGTEVVELGPVNRTIHQVNERVRSADLDLLSDAYLAILKKLLL